MSKIVSMSAGAIDPIAQTKRVFWRPDTSATVLKVGQPVCYNSDIVGDHKERTTDPAASHLGGDGTDYAEGAQTYTGRLFIVEEPLSANIQAFAGIVKSLGPKAGADGDMIEIFTPVEGAIVPVYTDENCTLEQTLLGIRNGEADVTYPGKVIGVAQETKDRSGTDGMVWMRFMGSAWIRYDSALLIDDECGSDVLLDYTKVTSYQTAGGLTLRYLKGTLEGTGGFGGGMFKLRAELNAAASDTCQCLSAGFTIQASGELTNTGFTYCNGPLHAAIGTSGAPDLSGGSLAGLIITYYVTETGGEPQNAFAIYVDSGDAVYADMDGLLHIFHAGDMGDAAQANTSTQTWSTDDITIPIKIGTTTYYLYASAAAGAA